MRIEMPKFELPKVPKLEVPKLELPKLELPKIGGGSKKEAIFIDDNPNAAPKAAAPKAANVEAPAGSVRVRAATAPKKAFSVADKEAPTLAELQKSKGIQVTISDGQYKQFPVRRLPGETPLSTFHVHFADCEYSWS